MRSRGKAALDLYRAKRDFEATPEPKGARRAAKAGRRFVVQKHDARRLHYDLRLELDGVLKSWAVTRGPSLVPGEKRLAVETEDHPIDYLTFEGVIPKGQYGGGTMIVWDRGRWTPEGDPHKGFAKGHLAFTLDGERLGGRWHLVRTRPKAREARPQWLLLKSEDEHARAKGAPDILEEETTSLLSGVTNDELAQRGEVRPDHAARTRSRGKAAANGAEAPRAAGARGARKGILPPFVEPCLATLKSEAPSGPDWLFEVKLDGYRTQARLEGGDVRMLTRRGLNWTERFAPIARHIAGLPAGAALIDGEVVVENEAGLSDFAGLQEALKAGEGERLAYHAFDLLYLEGLDLRASPLIERKRLLAELLAGLPEGSRLRYSDHLIGDGAAMVRHACRLGLEGIIAKRAEAPYRSGRGETWLKVKCTARQEFVVAGFVPSSVSRRAVGSLVLGVYEEGRLVHVGRTGTGFTAATARELYATLAAQKRPTSPFAETLPSAARKDVVFVEPRLVAEVELRGYTGDGMVRHAAFKGLRDDKEPTEVVREKPAGAAAAEPAPARAKPRGRAASASREVAGITLTHPDRVLWEEQGLTKLGLAEFYAEIADWVLPQIMNRPLALVRCPSGRQKACFFQKHLHGLNPDAVDRVVLGPDEGVAIRDLRGLVALVQAGVLEIHPWGSTLADVEHPDRLTFDLDPGEGVGFAPLAAAAREVRDRLKALKLDSLLKTTGGKGLHVVVPLKPKADWEEAKAFAKALAEAMERDSPALYTATLAKSARVGRIFVDYLRNGRGATAVAAYSTRARSGAPVATPIAWEELDTLPKPDHFTVANLPARLAHLGEDPWAMIRKTRQTLPAPAKTRARAK